MTLPTAPPDDGGDRGAPRVRHVDGPALPHLRRSSPSSASLVPILVPPLGGDDDDDGDDDGDAEQYLLVPNPRRIVARSARNGRRVGVLLPPGSDGATIRAAALAWLPDAKDGRDDDDDEGEDEEDDDESTDADDGGEWIVLAACGDGLVHEWPVAALSSSSEERSSDGGMGRDSIGPRRSFRPARAATNDAKLVHLASVQGESSSKLVSSHRGGAVLYGLADGNAPNDGKSASWLVRCAIPPHAPGEGGGEEGALPLPLTTLASVKSASSKSYDEEAARGTHICLRKKDAVLGLTAAYRPSSKSNDGDDRMSYAVDKDDEDDDVGLDGDVFVVVCASRGLVVCRDDHRNEDDDDGDVDAPPSLVHFTKLTSSRRSDERPAALSVAAISPHARDLALGRADGRIDVLDDVFSNVAAYLDAKGGVKGATRGDDDGAGVPHPEDATVVRTVHWHAHPVRALSFVSPPGGAGGASRGPSSLLSGGEESVLVHWQLDRNFHRPSDFVARVSHGAIVSILSCPRSDATYAFCADDSVQRLDGPSKECVWKERGLAALPLNEEEEEDDEERGPIIMVNDPITGLPMLTNLPGAPGAVHWYDPRTASVVGTLEVAPYNRVSRRDPSDPIVPPPSVTHLAVGEDGRDVVTVDVVWTENAGVGRPRRLPGPRGATMNACTSVKFWSHVDSSKRTRSDQRRRRAGDVPMGHELVSSMASPHGRGAGVCALAVAPDGGAACTLSREEGAFRLWVRSGASDASSPDEAGHAAPWRCLYKVRTPSGYANLLSRSIPGGRTLAFSSDGTVLSAAYGPAATLWDRSDATLLASVRTDGEDDDETEGGIRSVDFLEGDDALLLTTSTGIGVRSPFGGARSRYLGDDEWSLDVASLGEGAVVSAVAPLREFEGAGGLAAGGRLAVCVALASESVVCVVDREGGVARSGEGGRPLRWRVDGAVRSLCADGRGGEFAGLLAVTKDGRMLSLGLGSGEGGAGGKERRGAVIARDDVRARRAPVLKVGGATDAEEDERSAKRRRVSINVSGRLSSGEAVVSRFEFPNALSGRFTSAFIAKSLGLSCR